MSGGMETAQWDWQWTATFGVLVGFSVSVFLWGRGFQVIASVITIAAVILGMYVITSG